MTTTVRPSLDGGTLRQKLARLRRRIQVVTGLRGGSWLLGVVLASAAAAGLLDWHYHLPALVRGLVLVGTLLAAGAIFYRHLLLPFRERRDDLSLALKIEESYPSLNDSLASAVEFLDGGAEGAGASSPSLRREATRRAMAEAAGCDFGRVVDARGLRSGVLAAAAVAGGAVALLLLYPVQARTALVRLLDPFGAHDWPRKTRLVLQEPRLRIGQNDPFVLLGTVEGVIPSSATLVVQPEGGAQRQLPPFPIQKNGEKTGSLHIRLSPGQMQQSFRAQVRANDAESPWYEVKVLPPPVLASLDGALSPQVRLDYPPYTDLPSPRLLKPGTGNVDDSVTGTLVTVRGAADRPLRRAWVELQPEMRAAPVSAFLGPLGNTGLLSLLALEAAGRTVWDSVPAALDPEDPARFTVRLAPWLGGFYLLRLEDDLGLHSSFLYELRHRADPAPTVQLERPHPARDLLTALPGASLPLQVVAEDPTFAVRSVYLRYRTRAEEDPRRIRLYDQQRARRAVTAWTGLAGQAAPLRVRPTRLEFQQTLSLRDLRHRDGSPLRDGDVLILQACADDFDDVTLSKEPGCSHEVRIHVVTHGELEKQLGQEQAGVQEELLRIREKEREAQKVVQRAEHLLERNAELTAEEQADLLRAEQLQQQIQERVGNRKGGLRAQLDRIRETLKNNGLQDGSTADRIEDVAGEIERLAENELPRIALRLLEARRLGERREGAAAAQEARLEQQAREARDAEKREKDEATRAEKAAEQLDDPREKKRLQEDAEQHRRLAEEAAQRAQQLEQERARLRDRGDRPEDPAGARQALANVKQMQGEVERTLNDLLSRMEPWSSTREVKGEAGQLLRDQQELERETQRLEQTGVNGKRPEELTPQERADLRALRDRQEQLEERTQALLERMRQMAEQRAEKDPETARELQEAHEQAAAQNIPGQMKMARDQIDRNQLGQAQQSQARSEEGLDSLIRGLERRREAELDRLSKRLREVEKELAKLADDQDRLQKKIKEAEKLPDAAQRAEALRGLKQEQAGLRARTQKLTDELKRLRPSRADRALEEAGERMEEALRRLERGEQEPADQDEILDRLDEARAEVERAQEQTKEELAREQLERVAEALKRLAERQKSLGVEVRRIQDTVLQLGRWGRAFKLSLSRAGDGQAGLGSETVELAGKELEGAPVIARMVQRAGEAMKQAGERLGQMARESPELARLPDRETSRLQGLAQRRLEQVLEAIQDELNAPRLSQGQGGQGPEPEEGGGGQAAGESIPPLAQLKLLRVLEMEIRAQLADLEKEHPGLADLDEEGRKTLDRLLGQRKEIRELFETLRGSEAPAENPGGE